jgi:hypothetical protein
MKIQGEKRYSSETNKQNTSAMGQNTEENWEKSETRRRKIQYKGKQNIHLLPN